VRLILRPHFNAAAQNRGSDTRTQPLVLRRHVGPQG
jgi:hypothetical protein